MTAQAEQKVVPQSPGMERVPGWEVYPWLRAGFSTRLGGASFAYGASEQNLGWTPEDDPVAVVANRRAFLRAMAPAFPLELLTVRQVHGAVVHSLEGGGSSWMTADGKTRLEGDGLISTTSGSLLAVLTADCLPVLVADTRTHAVGAFHAGWRGTLAGVVRNGLAQMRKRYDTRPTDVIAALGPCIRSCCFEVGEEVRDTFLKQTPELQSCFLPERAGTLRMDLVAANKQQLLQEGVLPERIQVVGQCTACSRTAEGGRRYFSYRAEKTRTGRMLSGIAVIA